MVDAGQSSANGLLEHSKPFGLSYLSNELKQLRVDIVTLSKTGGLTVERSDLGFTLTIGLA